MSRPFDLYTRYLFTSGIDDVREVNDKLRSYGLDIISQKEYSQIASDVERELPPSIFKQLERKKYSSDYMKWMRHLKVSDLWPQPDRDNHATDLKLVYDMHTDRIYKLSLQAMLLKNISITEIQQTLAAKFSANYKEKHLVTYREFFFNPARMTREDWLRYLEYRDSQEKHVYFMALSEEVETLKAELGLYSNVSASEELSRLLRKSINKSNQYLKHSSKESNAEARAWITTTINLMDRYERYRSADSTDFGKNLQMEFEYIDHEFPSPDEATLTSLNAQSKARELKKDQDDEEAELA